VFAVNVLAPYVLTALITRPARLIYLSSGMHHGTQPNLDDVLWRQRPWQGAQAYAESKLHDVLRGCAALAGGPLQCAGTRLGANAHGRPECAG